MINFDKVCKQFVELSLNLSDFVVFNDDNDNRFIMKLVILRNGLIKHIDNCKICVAIHTYQPERSKREDLDCKECKSIKWNIETECNPYILLSLIDESKMRCSEHCGNTVREAK